MIRSIIFAAAVAVIAASAVIAVSSFVMLLFYHVCAPFTRPTYTWSFLLSQWGPKIELGKALPVFNQLCQNLVLFRSTS
tara:strand:+ start:81 stop:317 length:237 start_codon:yes stop_codon:yes gene_type:complete